VCMCVCVRAFFRVCVCVCVCGCMCVYVCVRPGKARILPSTPSYRQVQAKAAKLQQLQAGKRTDKKLRAFLVERSVPYVLGPPNAPGMAGPWVYILGARTPRPRWFCSIVGSMLRAEHHHDAPSPPSQTITTWRARCTCVASASYPRTW